MPPEKSKKPPTEIRKACMILGLSPEQLTAELVNQAWTKQMVDPAVDGDQESSIFLNRAKDTLLKWIDGQLGFGFGRDSYGGSGPSGVPNKPLPSAGSGDVALRLTQHEENFEA